MIPAIASVNQADLATQQLEFKRQLENVVAKIAIASDFTITYEDLEPLEVASELKEYLNQIAPIALNRYLADKLEKYIYTIFSTNVSSKSQNSLLKEENTKNLPQTNYANKWSKTKFYQELTQNNHGQGYADPDWLVIKQVDDCWHVTKNDLTLHIQPGHLVKPSEELYPEKLVSLKMPPSLVERGIYIAVGDAGSANNTNNIGCTEDIMSQLYFNVGTGGALCLLDSLTQKLNQVRVPFDFKINYNEAEFDKFDAVILEFRSGDSDLIYSVIQTVYQDHQAYFRPEIPFFCKFLAPGLGFAEKPRSRSPKGLALKDSLRISPGGASVGKAQSPKVPQENIGQYFCGIIASALVEEWQQEWQQDNLPEKKLDNKSNNKSNNKFNYVLNYLSEKGVDIEYLYLNPDLNLNPD
jgi:hypothetical protein